MKRFTSIVSKHARRSGSSWKVPKRCLLNGKSQLDNSNINSKLRETEYAVRGELVIKAEELQQKIQSGPDHGLPFDELIFCNIGNPQQLKQKPMTFNREVLSLCTHPDLLEHPDVGKMFSQDAIDRASKYMAAIPGVGAYSSSQGVQIVREEVADFISKRDGLKANPNDIFLTEGASNGAAKLLQALIRDEKDGVMIPIPQYPMYSANLTLLGGTMVNYYLDESSDWGLTLKELERSYEEALGKGVNVRALAVINPGNPTGQVLPLADMKEVVEFCYSKNIMLIADEVYQENIYSTIPFNSFRKVAHDMGTKYEMGTEIASLHSVSKGFLGECGLRGGYMEFSPAIHMDAKEQIYKALSISLCSNISGQLSVGLMVNPPKDGEDAAELYSTERKNTLDSLKRRALKLAAALNDLEGVTCNPIEGALYAFPQITLPLKAIEEAKNRGKSSDAFYCLELLDATGICIVPGSGFGQVEGTFHFRTTILPSEDKIETVVARVSDFHAKFMDQYR